MDKEPDGYAFMWTVLICVIIFIISLLVFFPDTIEESQPTHECTQFRKEKVRKMITPLTYVYRDALICIECGEEYDN